MRSKFYAGLLVLVMVAMVSATYTANWSRGPNYDSQFWTWPNGPGNKWIAETEDYLDGTTATTNQRLTTPTITSPTLNHATEVVAATDVLTVSQSGYYLVYTDGNSVTLPDAAAGLVYYLVDGNATAGKDLTVDPQAGDSINGDTAGNYIQNQTDADGCMAILIGTAANTWYAVYTPSAWVEE